jgi:hypothetical protein
MQKIKFFLMLFLLILPLSMNAQWRYKRYHGFSFSDNTAPFVANYVDSLNAFKYRLDSIYSVNDSISNNNSMANNDGKYYRLFAPLTFYRSVARKSLRLNVPFDGKSEVDDEIDNTLMNIYLNRPELVKNSEKQFKDNELTKPEFTKPIRHDMDFVRNVAPKPIEQPIDIVPTVLVTKPNFWTFSGDYYLQFLQNYVSGNWYKGGESNYSMVGSSTMQMNYNNKQKVKWDNKLEMKLGFQTSKGDTLHRFKTSEDLLRYTGELGLQATKHWYYTFQLIAYTQFTRTFKSNDAKVYSDFFSPFNTNVSFGMDYKVEMFKKTVTGNIHLAPLAYNFRYVGRLSLAQRYGLDAGKHTMNDFGSQITVDLTWKLDDMIKWQTRLYGYTTYKRAELEWENTITFKFNKYISTNIFIYPRFDDGTTRDDHHGYWQFKEYASLGFAYSF